MSDKLGRNCNERRHAPFLAAAVIASVLSFEITAARADSDDPASLTAPDAGQAPQQYLTAPIEMALEDAIRDLVARTSSMPVPAGLAELQALQSFYAGRNYKPLWAGPSGLSADGASLLAKLTAFDAEAPVDLTPEIGAIAARRLAAAPAQIAELDWLLNLALLRGAVNPADPLAAGPQTDALALIAKAKAPLTVAGQWLPRDPAYWQLRRAVESYRQIAAAGGWPTGILGEDKEDFAAGVRSAQIVLLRQRLTISGDYAPAALVEPAAGGTDTAAIAPNALTAPAPDAATPDLATPDLATMDPSLIEALKRFQERHGLIADGVVGRYTLDHLNVPVEQRLQTMLINLRRMQLADRAFGHDYVAVNIAGQEMKLVQGGRTTMTSVVIVGRTDRRTPEVDSAINRIEFNPVWYVPKRIASVDLLPKIKNDGQFLASQGFSVYDSATGQNVDAGSVDWHGDEAAGGRYKLRQRPGSGNALGSAKFLFPNNHDVYLHGTNKPSLFSQQVRTLSSGCIRLPDAPGFAEAILMGQPDWNRERIDAVIAGGRNTSVTLATPLPVHLIYQTAWMDEQGIVHFRSDIYGRDKRIAKELRIAAVNP